MMYRAMIDMARSTGYASEEAMERSITAVDDLLESIKDSEPEKYWRFMRKTHEGMFGPHYDSIFANIDLSMLKYTDAEGIHREGPHWTHEQVMELYTGKQFPSGTTECDKWVAANVMYSDLCRRFSESEIIDASYLFFFGDEDWPGKGKIWEYMKK